MDDMDEAGKKEKTEYKGIHKINYWMGIVAAIFICMMSVVNVSDVLGRFIFNFPIKGSYELIGLLLVCGGSWGMGLCESMGKHISIGIVVDHFSVRVRAIISVFTYALSFTTFGIIAWQLLVRATRGGQSEDLALPLMIFYLLFAVGIGMFCVTLLVHLCESAGQIRRRDNG